MGIPDYGHRFTTVTNGLTTSNLFSIFYSSPRCFHAYLMNRSQSRNQAAWYNSKVYIGEIKGKLIQVLELKRLGELE